MIIVVFIFLQGWRATLIPALAVPVSLIGTFAIFPVIGFSINTIALMGMVLAIGLVVDDAIVVVEAVEHHIEKGKTPKEAAIKAMEEVAGPVVAIGLVLSAVFLPTVFIPGITGRLYQQFAVTIAISMMISVFVALSLSPALSALILKPKNGDPRPAREVLRLVQRYVRQVDERVCPALRNADPEVRHEPHLPRDRHPAGRPAGEGAAREGFCLRRTRATSMPASSFPMLHRSRGPTSR